MKKLLLPMIIFIVNFVFIPNVDALNMVQNPNVTVKTCAKGESTCLYGDYNEPRIRLAAGTTVKLKVHSSDYSTSDCFVLYDDNTTLTLVINDAESPKEEPYVISTLGYYASTWNNTNNLKTKYPDYSVGISTHARVLFSSEYSDFYTMITTKANDVDEIVKFAGGKQYWSIGNKNSLSLTGEGSGASGVVLGVVEVPKYIDKDSISESSGSSTESKSPGDSSQNQNSNSNSNGSNTSGSQNGSSDSSNGNQTVKVANTSKEVYLPYIIGSFIVIGGIIFITYAYKKIEKENTD